MDGINRRGFFGLLAGGLIAAADPERLLWTPGKLISIPRPRGNQLLTASMITAESLRMLKTNLAFAQESGGQYAGRFLLTGSKIGDSLTVRAPYSFVTRNGRPV